MLCDTCARLAMSKADSELPSGGMENVRPVPPEPPQTSSRSVELPEQSVCHALVCNSRHEGGGSEGGGDGGGGEGGGGDGGGGEGGGDGGGGDGGGGDGGG